MIVDNALYRKGERVDLGLETDDLAGVRAKATEPDDFVWVGLHHPDSDELEAVADLYDLHPLAVEDAISAHQRPKVERYDESLFIVLKTLWYVDEEDAVETGEISLFVGHKFVVSVRHGSGGGLSDTRHRLEGMHNVLAHGPSAVVYAVCDQVVDRYEEVAGSLQEDVDEVEQSVFSTERTNDSARIYVLKRELAEMRRAVLPLREPMNKFADGAVRGIHSDAGALLPRRRRPPAPGGGDDRQPRLAALHRVRGPHRADLDPAERRHAPDHRRGRPGRGADPGRQHLRHELQAHARAAAGSTATRGRWA